jgi:hypothetical protein
MLRVKIDLVPFGDEAMTKQIAEMVIANAGHNANGTHKYVASYADDRGNKLDGVLLEHDRNQSVLELVRLVSEVLCLETLDQEMLKNLHLDEYLERLKAKITLK